MRKYLFPQIMTNEQNADWNEFLTDCVGATSELA